MENPVLVIMIETFSLERAGWGFSMVHICKCPVQSEAITICWVANESCQAQSLELTLS
jgi:hypothetical protein